MNFKLIAYAADFASFLIQKFGSKHKIRNIILFGSVARGEESKGSDVDLFVDLNQNSKETEKEVKRYLEEFIKSAKFNNYWKLLGIENEIKLTIGELNKWPELRNNIVANGIVLYGKFNCSISGESKTFFFWENVKPNSKRVLFNKQMFGYNQNKKFYPGLIQKYHGERMSKGSIIVPLEHANLFHQQFKKYKATVKIKKAVEM